MRNIILNRSKSIINKLMCNNLPFIRNTVCFSVLCLLLILVGSSLTKGQRADNFNPIINGGISAIAIQPDGKILIGGDFSNVNGEARQSIARLNADGTLDLTFGFAAINGSVRSIAMQPDGRIVVGIQNLNGGTRLIVRLNSDGSFDNTFTVDITGGSYVADVKVQSDGKILIGGFFTSVGSFQRNRLARLNADGTVDTTFNPNANGTVTTVELQPDGKILVGGVFTTIGGLAANKIARLNTDGTVDNGFSSPYIDMPAGFGIYDIALMTDGRIVVGGNFPPGNGAGKLVARLANNGAFDNSFNQNVPVIEGEVRTVAVQADGKVLLGGILFDLSKPVRLNSNGTRDFAFNPNPNQSIFTFAIQPDGKILVGGGFTNIGGKNVNYIARLRIDSKSVGTKFDFNRDSKADLAVFRPSNGLWYLSIPQQPFFASYLVGASGDKIVPADYDGDGLDEFAVFRSGTWIWRNPRFNGNGTTDFGSSGDIPVPADYTGDGRADFAFFRNGVWEIRDSYTGERRTVQFGLGTDKPVPADFDGDRIADIAVFRDGYWYWLQSSDGGFRAVHFGSSGDKPIAEDFDGDGRADQAVYRAGFWYILQSTAGFTGVQFGIATDIPVAADYDGDEKADVAVYRNGNWYRLNSSDGQFSAEYFGTANDKPAPSAFIY